MRLHNRTGLLWIGALLSKKNGLTRRHSSSVVMQLRMKDFSQLQQQVPMERTEPPLS